MALTADDCLFYAFFLIGFLGLSMNGFALFIILKKQEIRQKGYAIFIIYRVLLDSIVSINLMTSQPLGISYWLTDPIWCAVAGGILMILMMTAVLLEALLGVNRYVSVCHKNSYEKIFRKRNMIFMCVLITVLSVLLFIPHVINRSLGRVPGYFCSIKLDREHLLVIVFTDYVAVSIVYAVVIFCYRKIYLFLKNHYAQIVNIQNDQLSSRLQGDKSLLKYLGATAVLPIATEMPALAVVGVRMYDESLVSSYVMVFAAISLVLLFVLNPILIVCVIKPIRIETQKLLKRILKKNQVSAVNIGSIVR